jgi:hypothetical protein
MPIINVPNPRNFPNRQMLDFRGTPEQAEKLHPGNTIYVFRRPNGSAIVMIDPGQADPQPEDDSAYERDERDSVYWRTDQTALAAELAEHDRNCNCPNCNGEPPDPAPADLQPEPDPAPTKSLGSVLDNLQLKF